MVVQLAQLTAVDIAAVTEAMAAATDANLSRMYSLQSLWNKSPIQNLG